MRLCLLGMIYPKKLEMKALVLSVQDLSLSGKEIITLCLLAHHIKVASLGNSR